MKLPSLDLFLQAFLKVARRFPLPLAAALTGTFSSIYLIDNQNDVFFQRIVLTMLLALPAFTGVKAMGESKQLTLTQHGIAHAIVAVLLGVFFYFLDPTAKNFEYTQLPRLLVLLAVTHLWVSFAPFIKSELVEDFWEYNKQLFGNLFTGIAYSFILWVGISIAHLAVNELFNAGLSNHNYVRLAAIIFGIFNTVYFLFHFPDDFQFDASEIAYNDVFKNLCKYILIPIVGLYFLILYAFGSKILVTWELPQGWVSSLVIGFAAAGIFTWLLNFLLPKYDDSSLVNKFRRWFWPVLFPLIALLFAGVGHRIYDYGVTESRFLVAHTGAWLLLCCVFFVIIKSNDLKFIPMSMAAFMLVGIFGPFSAFKSAERSQLHQFKYLLERNSMLENGKAKRAANTLKGEDADRIASCLDFFEKRQKADELAVFFDDFNNAKGNGSDNSTAFSLAQWLNIERRNAYGETEQNAEYSVNCYDYAQPVNIAGYNYAFSTNIDGRYDQISGDINNQNLRFSIKKVGNDNLLEWENKSASPKVLPQTFDLQSYMKLWAAKVDSANQGLNLTLRNEECLVKLPGKNAELLVFVHNCSFYKEGGRFKLGYLDGNFFVKEPK